MQGGDGPESLQDPLEVTGLLPWAPLTLSSWNPGALYTSSSCPGGTWSSQGGRSTVQFGQLQLPGPHVPPADQALWRGGGEASIALWWQLLGPHVTVPCCVLTRAFLKQLASILGAVSCGGCEGGGPCGRRGKASCMSERSPRVSDPSPPKSWVSSSSENHGQEAPVAAWRLMATRMECLPASPRAQAAFVTGVCSAPSQETPIWRVTLLVWMHQPWASSRQGVGSGAEGLLPVLSLQDSGGSPSSHSRGETQQCRSSAHTL